MIQQQVQNPLATELLKGKFTEGSSVKIDYRDGEFTFERLEHSDPIVGTSASTAST